MGWRERKTRNRQKPNCILCGCASTPLSEKTMHLDTSNFVIKGKNLSNETKPWPSEHCGVCFSNYLRTAYSFTYLQF